MWAGVSEATPTVKWVVFEVVYVWWSVSNLAYRVVDYHWIEHCSVLWRCMCVFVSVDDVALNESLTSASLSSLLLLPV